MRSERVSRSGRFANLVARRAPKLLARSSRWQARLYRRLGDHPLTRMMGKPTFMLTVAGRLSGEPRTVMLMLVERGEDLLVCGSFGGRPVAPDWWRNLTAAGGGTATVRGRSYEVTARVVTDSVERAACWDLLVRAYPDFAAYQALTERELPIAVLSPTLSASG